jgi:hypothetical protein
VSNEPIVNLMVIGDVLPLWRPLPEASTSRTGWRPDNTSSSIARLARDRKMLSASCRKIAYLETKKLLCDRGSNTSTHSCVPLS